MVRKSKITSSFSVSRFADQTLEEMVDSGKFSTRSSAVESSILLMHAVMHVEKVLPAAAQVGITPL
jgi:Arc/MetJ-type ribon-helix-helix transcriptional regulator